MAKIRRCDIEVDTRSYEFAHGRAPRGRGGWAFSFYGEEGLIPQAMGDTAGVGGFADYAFAPFGPYGDAKRWAVDRAIELGANRVRVES